MELLFEISFFSSKGWKRLTRTFIICIDIGIIWISHRKNGNLGSTYLVSYGFKGAKCVILYRRKKSSNNWRKRPKCNLISFSWLYLRRVASGEWVFHWQSYHISLYYNNENVKHWNYEDARVFCRFCPLSYVFVA